jgi:hypothetical protein
VRSRAVREAPLVSRTFPRSLTSAMGTSWEWRRGTRRSGPRESVGDAEEGGDSWLGED